MFNPVMSPMRFFGKLTPQSRVYVSFVDERKVVPLLAGHPSSAVAGLVLVGLAKAVDEALEALGDAGVM